MSFNCPNCTKQYDSLQSLVRHWTRGHKENSEALYLLLNVMESPPTCKCGCGEETKFLDAGRGYSDFRWGHKARMKGQNNFQKGGGFEKSLKTRRKMFEEGTLQIWNKDETKESHPSIAQYGINGSKSISSNPEELKVRSKRMQKGRKDGTIPTLRKEQHSQWKGGVSPLNVYCRNSVRLYAEWKHPLLKASNFSCSECGEPGPGLEVHHDGESMSKVVRKFAKKFGWTTYYNNQIPENDAKLIAMKDQISEAVAEYHVSKPVSGKVLCVKCHNKEHDHLNR